MDPKSSHPFLQNGKEPLAQENDESKEVKCSPGEIDDVSSTPTISKSRFMGIFYTILSVNMFSLTTTIMKKYSYIHPFNVVVWGNPAAILVTTIAILYTKFVKKQNICVGLLPFSKQRKHLLFLWVRALLSSVISYLTVTAFQYVTAADVRTVVSASVIVVYVFSWMFLGEKCGVVPIIVAFVALCGIGIMTRPPVLTGTEFDRDTLIGIALAFASMIVIAMNVVIIRYLNQIHYGITNLVVFVWGSAQAFVLGSIFSVFAVPTWAEFGGLSLSGLFLSLALCFLVLALQKEEAGVVSLIRTCEVIFVFFWQWVIMGTYPDLISLVGASLIISGVIAVTLRKWVESLPPEERMRKTLRFLLL